MRTGQGEATLSAPGLSPVRPEPRTDGDLIGVNWGSSRFRAYRFASDGRIVDEIDSSGGIADLDRAGIAAAIGDLTARWPDHGVIYASGMIGSNVGWTEVPYAVAPASADVLARGTAVVRIGVTEIRIVPGVACRRIVDGAPDVMRGEEVELLGLTALGSDRGSVAVLPGTHSKWVRMSDGAVTDFFTSMSGEIIDRLTAQGLLASIVAGTPKPGPAFREGVLRGEQAKTGLATQLFGVRARVLRDGLAKEDAASDLRGLLIGAELADARRLIGLCAADRIVIVGNAALSALYADALSLAGIASSCVSSRDACAAGFRLLDAAARR